MSDKRKNNGDKTPYEKVKEWLQNPSVRAMIKRTLPEGMHVDAWIEMALVSVRTSDRVQNCEPMSILGALITIASMGLRLENALGQAYLEARVVKDDKGNIDRYEAQVAVGYRGILDMMYRNPEIQDIETFFVHQNDNFEFQRGTNPFARHSFDHTKPKAARGKPSLVVTGLRYKTGYYSFDLYPFEDLLEHREKVLLSKGIRTQINEDGEYSFYGKSRGGGEYKVKELQTAVSWIKWPTQMFLKTCIRWSAKYWNMSGDVQQAAQLTDMEEANVSQGQDRIARALLPQDVRMQIEGNVQNPSMVSEAQGISLAQNKALGEQMKNAAMKGKEEKPEDGEQAELEKAAKKAAAKKATEDKASKKSGE